MKIKKVSQSAPLPTGTVVDSLQVTSSTNAPSIRAVKEALSNIFPIGSIYMSVNNTNPSNYFGGTWESWGQGRVPVGVDTNDTDFDTVEETGGSKELQEHYHNGLYWKSTTGTRISLNAGGGIGLEYSSGMGDPSNNIVTANAGTGNSGNLQPYITCYMWKRTA